jgi:putative heme transporter
VPYVTAAILLGAAALLHVGSARAPVGLALVPTKLVFISIAAVFAVMAAGRRGRPRGEARWRRVVREGVAMAPEGLRDAWALRRSPLAMLGACGYWVGDCGVLWATFHGLGLSPPIQVIVLAYMLGQLGNILPLPGGVGGVEPATVGVLTASGVALTPAAAAVLCYRAISLGTQGVLGTIAFTTLIGGERRAPA